MASTWADSWGSNWLETWSRGAQAPPAETPNPRGGGRIYPYPSEPKKKRKKVIPAPVPAYEVSGPLSRQRAIEHSKPPEYDVEKWEAGFKTLQALEREDRRKRQRKSEAALLLLLLH